MPDIGTRATAEKWGVTQQRVRDWCKRNLGKNPYVSQDRKGSTYHISPDCPNPFKK